MTTSDGTGIIEEPRSLDVLLKSTTYQGMTDEEIQRIIDYRVQVAQTSAEVAAQREAIDAQTEAMREHWQEQAATAEAAFNNAVMSTVRFQGVEV